jgi:hypothetical protein
MADHRRTKRLERLGADFNRTGYVQFNVRHKSFVNGLFSQFVKFFTSGRLLAREVFSKKVAGEKRQGTGDGTIHELPSLRAAVQNALRFPCIVKTRDSVLDCGSPLPLSLRANPYHIPMRGFKNRSRYIIVGIALSLENILADGGKSRETLRP